MAVPIQSIAFVVVGLALLIFSSDVTVERSRRIAKKLGVSELLIGLTIVSIGTSIPEIFVNILAGLYRLQGLETSGIAVGNIIGSCLSQITIILGISGMVATTLHVPINSLKRDGSMMVAALFLMFIAAYDGNISQLEGGFLVLIYVIYLAYLYRNEKNGTKRDKATDEIPVLDFIILLGALIVVVASSSVVVREGMTLATSLEISPFIIGILAGLGTSLPELSVSVGALGKGAKNLSLGNLIGSNITDPLFSLGAGALVAGFAVDIVAIRFDFLYWGFASIVALLLLWNNMNLNRKESSIMILIFLMYVSLKTFF